MNENEVVENTAGPSTSPADAAQTAVASAVETVTQEIAAAAPAAQPEPMVAITGPLFFGICQYLGSKPYAVVQNIRPGLFQVQREQNCLSPQQLPQHVTLSINNINVLGQFLRNFPYDEVHEIIGAFDQEVQAFINKTNQEAAAAQQAAEEAAAAAERAKQEAAGAESPADGNDAAPGEADKPNETVAAQA